MLVGGLTTPQVGSFGREMQSGVRLIVTVHPVRVPSSKPPFTKSGEDSTCVAPSAARSGASRAQAARRAEVMTAARK